MIEIFGLALLLVVLIALAVRAYAEATRAEAAEQPALEHRHPPRRNWPDPDRRAAERQHLLRLYVEGR